MFVLTMKRNFMTFDIGLNKLWPTDLLLDTFEVTEDLINETIQNVTTSIEKLSVKYFDKYLLETLGHDLSFYSDYKLLSWVNRYSTEESMEYHTHSGSWLSAIFYLECSSGGELVLHDPRNFASRGYDLSFRKLFDTKVYNPVAGQVVVFPSFLYHTVRPTIGFKLSVPVDLFLFKE